MSGSAGHFRDTVTPAPKSSAPINEENMNSYRISKIVDSTVSHTLRDIWNMGSLKDPSQTLEDYFLNTIGLTKAKYKEIFYKEQRAKMSRNDLCSLDVTHMFSLIKYGNEKLAGEHDPAWSSKNDDCLESLLTSIKRERNEIIHDRQAITKAELLEKADRLRGLLEQVLQVAGQLYLKNQTEVDEKISKMKSEITEILYQDLSQMDLNDYKNKLLCEELKEILKNKGKEELKGSYGKWSQVNPVFFVQGEDSYFDINSVFVRTEVEKVSGQKKGSEVPCEKLIKFCMENSSWPSSSSNILPETFLVEGSGGAGKTTLIKLFLSQWSNGTGDNLGLDQFDLILLMECRNRKIKSFAELLSHLLPKTNANYFMQGDLLKCAQQLRILVIIDGLDEMNSSSQELFRDILETQKTSNIVLLCTSRPEKVSHFYKMVPGEYRKAHLRIHGVPDKLKGNFLRIYHDQMKAKGKSNQNTEDLVEYLHRSPECLRDHYRLPLNLVLLAWLWSGDPARVNSITTPTEFYSKYLELIQDKLIERLRHRESTQGMTTQELKQKIQKYLRTLYHEALEALKRDFLEKLPSESVNALKVVCQANSLPHEETLPAYLTLKRVGSEEHVSFPHKLNHDFFSARGLMSQLFNETTREENKQMIQVIVDLLTPHDSPIAENVMHYTLTLEDKSAGQGPSAIRDILSDQLSGENDELDLSKYQSVLVHLAGCLDMQTEHLVQDCTAHEIVQLLKRSGMGSSKYNKVGRDDDWFRLLDNTKNDAIVRYVAQEIHRDLTITNSRVDSAIHLLKYANPALIILDMIDPWSVPGIQSLLERISERPHKVDIIFGYEFLEAVTPIIHHPALESVFRRCQVEDVMCRLDVQSLLALPPSVGLLQFPIMTDEEAQQLLPALQRVCTTLQHLQLLVLYVDVSIDPDAVQPLPCRSPRLFLLGVTSDIMRTCNLIAKLQPQNSGFKDIQFCTRLGYNGCWTLLDGLKKQNVRVDDYICFWEELLYNEEVSKLEDATKYKLVFLKLWN